MNRLSILIIRSWIGPFFMTFFIALFVLVMQFLWKYIDDLAGKGLEILIILELLLYASATLVPLALPLANLLSSIMTMGSFAENLEIVAAKSSGISLMRYIRPLMIASFLTAVIAFLFSNYAMPVANYKLRALLIAIQKQKPAIDIPEGEYYDGIKGLIVYIGHKSDDQRTFRDVVLYDHTQENMGNSTVMVAEEGSVAISDDNNFLSFTLKNGNRYAERNFYGNREKGLPFFRESFREQEVIIDLRELKFNRQNPSFIKNQYSMMDIGQLNQVYEETKTNYRKTTRDLSRGIITGFNFNFRPSVVGNDPTIPAPDNRLTANPGVGEQIAAIINDTTLGKREIPKAAFANGLVPEVYNENEKAKILETALSNVRDNLLQRSRDMETQHKSMLGTLARNQIEFHRKFTLSVACLLLFFIGAPLGAIIRKGGLGLPLICSIVIFIIYYVISTIGEKSVRNLAMDPISGMWLSTLILLPFGLFLTLKASTDSPIFSADTYTALFRKIFGKKIG